MIETNNIQEQAVHYHFKASEIESDIQYYFEQLHLTTIFSFDSKLKLSGTILLGKYFKLISHVTNFTFRLHSNNLGCAGISGIASGLSYLTSLKHLSITVDTNDIGAEGTVNLFKELSHLTQLQSLSVSIGSQNNMCLSGAISLDICISKLINLTSLTIIIGSKNHITPQGIGHIANGFCNLTNLQQLKIKVDSGNVNEFKALNEDQVEKYYNAEIEHNKKKLIGFEQIGQSISQLKCLESLDLTFHEFKINTSGFESLTTGLTQLTNLKHLAFDITQKTLCEKASISMGKSIRSLRNLESLIIDFSQEISKEGAISMGEGIGELKNLKQFAILVGSYCKIGEESTYELFSRLNKLEELEDLSIVIESSNYIKQKGGVAIGMILAQSLKLKKLVLSIERDNQLGEIGTQNIGNQVSLLQHLTDLQIKIGYQNEISQAGFSYLCEGINKLVNLRRLKIEIDRDNNLNQNAINHLNYNLKTLTLLENLQISIAAPEILKFNLADAFSKMNELKYLDLMVPAENKITQGNNIGKSLSFLKNLTHLSIFVDWGNKLGSQGATDIGEAIQNLVNLKSLKLFIGFENGITQQGGAAIARSLENLINLEAIDLTIDKGNLISDSVVRAIYLSLKKVPTLRRAKFNIKEPTFFYLIPLLEHSHHLTEDNFEIEGISLQFNRTFTDEDHSKTKKFSFYFSLSNLNVAGAVGLHSAFDSLKDLPSLTNLNLIITQPEPLKAEHMQILVNSFKKLKRLEELSIVIGGKQFNFDDRMAKILFPVFSNLVLLKKFSFYLNYNDMTREGVSDICNALVKIKQIEILEIRFDSPTKNNTQGEPITDLFSKCLSKLTNLKKLSFWVVNRMHLDGMQQVIQSCQNMQQLKHLQIRIPTVMNQSASNVTNLNGLISPIEDLTNLLSLDISFIQHVNNGNSTILDLNIFTSLFIKMQPLRYLKVTFGGISKLLQSQIKESMIKQNKRLVELQIISQYFN